MLRNIRLIQSRGLGLARHRQTACAVIRYSRSYTARPVFVPSTEQADIVEQCRTRNVVVSARPGVGKTATAEALVRAYPDVPIAIVTYSKRLQMETQHRLAAYPNVDVYTFHGLAGRLSGRVILNDTLLRDLRRERALPTYPNIPPYAYVVLDELQDLSEDLHWVTEVFLSVITEMAGRAPQVLALGDARQAIYEFRGADARFLDLAPEVFSASPYEWKASELSRSFRLTAETAAFVNHAFLGGQQYITGVREGGPVPLYVQANLDDVPQLLDLLLPLIEKYGPENCAILSPSVRANPFLSPLTNALSEHHDVPIAISTSDEVPLDPDVVRGKLVVSTYHQFKGSERDLTIVYGVESSYFRAFARNLPDDTCPNATFVALTRARQQLVVIQSHNDLPMPFVDVSALSRYGRVLPLSEPGLGANKQDPPGRPPQLGLILPGSAIATDIARHVRDEELDELLAENLHIYKRATRARSINAPDKIITNPEKNHYEAVADLNGLTVTAAFEWHLRGKLTSFGYPEDTKLEVWKGTATQVAWLTREAAQFDANVSNYRSRLLQMGKHGFDWLVPHLATATRRLENELRKDGALQRREDLQFEVPLKHLFRFSVTEPGSHEAQKTRLRGRPDIVDVGGGEASAPVTIWEIKFVSALSPEHIVQAVVYGFLWATLNRSLFPRLVLFNVRDGTRWDIHTTLPKSRALIEGVLRAKYTAKEPVSDEEFLRRCVLVQDEGRAIIEQLKYPKSRPRKQPSEKQETKLVKRQGCPPKTITSTI